jgi:cytochrome c-type biogenesis protein CcmE
MEAHFAVDDGDATLPVTYTGILPEPVPREQAVIATDACQGGSLRRR